MQIRALIPAPAQRIAKGNPGCNPKKKERSKHTKEAITI
jgi:hypothetical protein